MLSLSLSLRTPFRTIRALIFDATTSSTPQDGCDESVVHSIEGQVSPHQMRRVGDEFGALQLPYTEQVRVRVDKLRGRGVRHMSAFWPCLGHPTSRSNSPRRSISPSENRFLPLESSVVSSV